MKKTFLQMTLAIAGVAAVGLAQAQPAPAPTAPGTAAPTPPAPTTTADPNAPPPPVAGSPTAPPTTTADPNAPPPPPAGTTAPQGDPNAPPPPPPVAPAPVTTGAPVAPPPTQFVPPPAPTTNWTAAPANPEGGDSTTPSEKPKPLRWRGTSFEWYQYANTQYFGLGSSYIGQEDFSYVHLFRFTPNFYVIDEPKDKLTVSALLWGSVEATNSNSTTYKNEFELRDTGISTRYARTLVKSPDVEGTPPEWTTSVSIGTGVLLPTSKASIQYRYLTWSFGPGIVQNIPILGSKSDFFPNVNVNASLTYQHFFNKTTTPTSDNVRLPRQTLGGDPLLSDQMGKWLAVSDLMIAGATITLPVYKDLSLAVGGRYLMKWKPNPTEGCVQTLTNCADPSVNEVPGGRQTFFADTIFDVAIAYNFFDVLDASVGYSNWTSSIGERGKLFDTQHNYFYSADSTFYLDLTASIDGIYSKASGREKKGVAKGQSSSSWF